MSDIIDINVAQTVEEVTINVTEEVIQVNINQVNGGGGIESIEAGDNISVDNTDPDNPIVSATGLVPYVGATSDVNLGEFGMLAGNLEFDNTPTNIPTSAGGAYWNDADGTLDLILKGGNVKLQVGQESVIRVVNKTATNINLLESNYQAVRVTGAQGQRLKVDLAQATTDNLSAETIGLVTETINNNQEGFITTSGLVRNINTTGSLQGETWADGDIVYLSPTIAGRITKVKPVAPNHLVIIGYVISAHATQGSIFVKVDNGYELDELHNVKIDTPLNNQGLVYNSTLQVWENKAIDLQSVLNEGNESTLGQGIQSLIIKGGDTYRDLVDDEMSIVTFGTASSVREIGFGWLDDSIAFRKDYESGVGGVYKLLSTNGGVRNISFTPDIKTTSFTAVNENNYTTNGTLTVTDPTPVTNKGYIVHVIGGTSTIGGVGYTTGALVYRFYNGSSWISTDMNNAITIDATPTDGSSNAVSSNGVFDALALKQPILIKQGLTELTGVTGVNVLASLLIPANWIASGDGIEIIWTPIKSVTASNVNFSIYHDTTVNGVSNSISTGAALSTVNRSSFYSRTLSLSGTDLRNSTAVNSSLNAPGATSTAVTPTTFDPTVNNYITITANPTVISEVVGFNQFFIRKL
jgi:hypothetical protein